MIKCCVDQLNTPPNIDTPFCFRANADLCVVEVYTEYYIVSMDVSGILEKTGI